MKLHVVSFGCQMNVADSEEMARPLRRRGFETTANLDEADCVLVNTCTIREHAEHRAVSLLGRLREWKRDDRLLIVAGCAAERLGGDLKRRFPFVDLVAGAMSIDRFPDMVERALAERFGSEAELFEQRDDLGPPPPPSPTRGEGDIWRACGAPAHTAFVTVMRGCNYACTYCIVPQVRGRELYRPFEAILDDVRRQVASGAVEVCFVGQTVNSWKEGARDFADLLRAAAGAGARRIRFMSPHPHFVGDRLIDAMAELPEVCPHLHLPAQSGSERILRLMRRNYTPASLLEKIGRLRARLPEVCLTTDFIVGFPSETERDFAATLDLFDEAGFDAAYCFKYSPRDGTEAASFAEPVPEGVKEERLQALLARVERRAREKARGMIGREVEVLLEDEGFGRTEGYTKLRLERAGSRLPAGRQGPLVRARVTAAEGAVLVGTPMEA